MIYLLIFSLPLNHLDGEHWQKQSDRTKVYKVDNNFYKVYAAVSRDSLKYKIVKRINNINLM